MATIRLTNDIKERIVHKLLEHRLQGEYEALIELGKKLAAKVMRDVFTKKELELMASLPDGWLPEETGMYLKCSRGFTRLYFNGEFYVPGLVKPSTCVKVRVPKSSLNGTFKIYEAGQELDEEIVKFEEAKSTLCDRSTSIKHQAFATLNAVTTVGALVKAWPEVESFCPKFDSGTNLPAIPTAQLNELFNLPVKE